MARCIFVGGRVHSGIDPSLLGAIAVPPLNARIPVTFALVLLALALTGALSAYLGGARWGPAVIRLVAGGAIAMAVTFGVGQLLGAAGI